jgi:Sec-independent protein translocase protein TatA
MGRSMGRGLREFKNSVGGQDNEPIELTDADADQRRAA